METKKQLDSGKWNHPRIYTKDKLRVAGFSFPDQVDNKE